MCRRMSRAQPVVLTRKAIGRPDASAASWRTERQEVDIHFLQEVTGDQPKGGAGLQAGRRPTILGRRRNVNGGRADRPVDPSAGSGRIERNPYTRSRVGGPDGPVGFAGRPGNSLGDWTLGR